MATKDDNIIVETPFSPQQSGIELQRLRSTTTREQETTENVHHSTPNATKDTHRVKWVPLLSLVAQHFSSSWGERSYEFASYLYLIALFPNSLLPASLLGLMVTGTGIALSGRIGRLVDEHKRLPFLRTVIALQKVLQIATYGLFLVLFHPLRPSVGGFSKDSNLAAVYVLLALIILASSIMGLATAGINVAIQRDWVVTISQGSHTLLTRLNTYLRRVDLLCKLLAPLLVSLLTTTVSYPGAVTFYLGYAVVTLVMEQLWIIVVWNHFGVLATDEKSRWEERRENHTESTRTKRLLEGLYQQGKDLKEFLALPVFLSSVSISLVYLTTLSFDGIMISYLKAERLFSDAFIAGMRGVSVVAGLLGTVAMPLLERRLGLVRAGAWSLWSQILSLVPVLLSLYIGLGSSSGDGDMSRHNSNSQGPAWNKCLLFGGMALSRIGLWSFDLVQLQLLQESLTNHPRKNALTALQLSLQNVFDLTKYALVLGLNKPSQFKWTALVSWIAVFTATETVVGKYIKGVVYSTYVYKMRGHLLHWQLLIFYDKRTDNHEENENQNP